MKPFTKAVFEKEGKGLVGSRWTKEQVQQAYEKADELLDLITYADKNAGLFNIGLLGASLTKLPNEAVQQLSLEIVNNLLERGLDIAATAAELYRTAPETFMKFCASSKQAFLKDKFFLRQYPASSFEAFRTQENPALCQDMKLAKRYAVIYSDPYPYDCHGIDLVPGSLIVPGAAAASKLVHKTRCIQKSLNRNYLIELTKQMAPYMGDYKEVLGIMAAARENASRPTSNTPTGGRSGVSR